MGTAMAGKGKRSFGSIRQLPTKVPGRTGRWQANYTGPDGAIHKAPRTFAYKIDAEAWLTDRRREIDRGLWSPYADNDSEPVPTFRDYSADFLDTRMVRGKPIRPRTRAHYAMILDTYLVPQFGDSRLDVISAEAVRIWYAKLLPGKDAMRAHCYSLLRTILNEAVRQDIIAANPCKITGASVARRASRTKPASLDELRVLISAMEPPRLRPMIALAAWCALRFGELVELRRRDIEFADDGGAIVHITRQAVRVGGTYHVGSPKSDAGIRDVHVPPHLVPMLEEHLGRHVGKGRDELLFPAFTDENAHLQPSAFNRHFYQAREVAKRKDLRFHDLRHSGAVLAAQSGATLAELMARLGHSSPAAAMRYQWAAQGRDREIARQLSKMAEDG
ncbi:site-specific integrase [Mycobacterium sp. OTB74]|jgi:integrase|uniref:tyrosine-type recombinase/integrase n=1 Tax=Mycobacterium sp. OTB74 TaxID=1853452 RepID=UPI0024765C19|nr:site-specific integrase [Mycobacterium sp. OTB74]MDH6247255.1 integrase [Mycobacterium sp. OTB74]